MKEDWSVSPTVLRIGAFRLFFFSREEPRLHVHVSHSEGEAKFWLEPTISLANNTGLPSHLANEAEQLVRQHQQEITDAWHRHFSD